MPYSKELVENFRFLVLETIKQVEDTRRILDKPSKRLVEKINSRDDYIDNLKGVILSKCFSHIKQLGELDEQELGQVKSIDVIANNLEHIADYCVNVVGQTRYLACKDFIHRYDYGSIFSEALGAMKAIEPSLLERDVSLALQICKSEFEIDVLYEQVFDRILEELRGSEDPENLITSLFIFRYLERMGDSLLNIGEAVISSVVGEKLKIHQYQAIEESLDPSGEEGGEQPFSYRPIAETQSGCSVGVVHRRGGDHNAQGIIFKEGQSRKILREKENIERWERAFPGLTPRIFGFQEQGEKSSILLEFLAGSTFQEILLGEHPSVVETALAEIMVTLEELWDRTLVRQPASAGYLGQLQERLDDILKVHPHFRMMDSCICDLHIDSLERLIEKVSEAEGSLAAPFTVLIHGDLNNDNVIFNKWENRIFFVDLYRSEQSDYVQDLSVFMVSGFRLPVFDANLRGRINQANLELLEFFRRFAARHDDRDFEARLGLGLARSFMTSTRFELNRDFSEAMFMRSVYLMCRVLEDFGRPGGGFRLPEDVLAY
jgi:phosphate uptake regulator/aminoglycoside phosphotransferase